MIHGMLTPAQQVKVLARIWGLDRDGYVFLPWVPGHCENKDERRANYHEGRAFEWPRERSAILAHIKKHTKDDLYFSVNLFNGKRRVEQLVESERVLYADLDPVDPRKLGALRPTIAWESSPSRFQGVWLLDKPKNGATWQANENHKLTTHVGADPSGWDATQILRVPGRPNYKWEYKSDGQESVSGDGLLWLDGPRYVWSDFDDLPEVQLRPEDNVDMLDEELLEGIDRHEVWGRVRLKLPGRTRELMALKRLPEDIDRSEISWEISRELADAGCTVAEIVSILRPTIWNKFAGRGDELKRLKIQAARAVAERPDSLEQEEAPKPNIQWLTEVASQHIPRPKWLVKDIWTRGGCGFISGAPKSYKSWMALDLAVTVATGGYWMNHPNYKARVERPVLYLQEEDDLRLVMQRLQIIVESKAPDRFWHGQISLEGDDPDDPDSGAYRLMWTPSVKDIPMAMHVQTGFIASDPGWQAWLDDIIEEGKFDLVLIDTLGTTAGEIDTDRSGEMMNQLLKPLKVLANKHDTAICIVHHNKKAAGENNSRAGNDMLGSVALHAWVDCAIYARTKNAQGEIAIEREAKLAADESMRIRIPHMHENMVTSERVLWEPEFVVDGIETVQEAEPERERKRGTGGKSVAFKLKQMGGGPLTTEQLMDRLGVDSRRSLEKQLESGVDNGYIEKSEGGWCVRKTES